MPVKALPRITAWSYSRLRDYVKCALLAKFKHVDKMKEPGSEPMWEGSYVDHLAEMFSTKQDLELLPHDFTKGLTPELVEQYSERYAEARKLMAKGIAPQELETFAVEFADLRKRYRSLHAQEELALTSTWQRTGWFDKNAWVRIKMDSWYDDKSTRTVIDFKNGKVRVEDLDQLDLYAIGAFMTAPASIEVVDAQLWYLSAGELKAKNYTRAEAEKLKKVWVGKTKQILADTTFNPNPGKHCSWCFFRKSNGGPCKH